MVVLFWLGHAKSNNCHIYEGGIGQGEAFASKVVSDPKTEFVLSACKSLTLHQRGSAAPGGVGDQAIQQPGVCRFQSAHFDDDTCGSGAAAGIQHMCGELTQESFFSDR